MSRYLKVVCVVCTLGVGLGVAPKAPADWSAFKDFLKSKGTALSTDSASPVGAAAGISEGQIAGGLKEALGNGARRAVEQLGKRDGFLKNAKARIPMPKHLGVLERGLRAVGQDATADTFIESMNRAAEKAVPQAASVFGDAITKMSIDDAKGILTGGDNAATDYLRRSSGDELKSRFRPFVDAAIDRVGVTRKYQGLVDKAGMAGGLIDTETLDLGSYVTEKALDGVFLVVGEEERKIRENPAARTTELLKKVFSK